MMVVCLLAGTLIVVWMLFEAFEAMVLPRRVVRPFRLTRLYYRISWRLWRTLAYLLLSGRQQQTFLSVFGPLSLFGLFVMWFIGLIGGFALLHHALAPETAHFSDALYLSGVTFTTLGYGDLVPFSGADRVLAVVEAGTGFGFFAVVIGYLPVLYQAFSRRETLISLLDARAGSPPSSGEFLLRLPPGKGEGEVMCRFLQEAEIWAAELLESHLSFPVLSYYRSQHDNQSWLATLLCALDTSALLLTVVEGVDRQQAQLTFAMARHALVDLALVLRRGPASHPHERLSEAQLSELCEALKRVGVSVRQDEVARTKLTELRSLYEPFAAAIGKYFCLTVPKIYSTGDQPDNWQTSAWMRRAGPITALGLDPRDEHFD